MASFLAHLEPCYAAQCIPLSGERLMVGGDEFVKVYCLKTYDLIQEILLESGCNKLLLTTDEKFLFVATGRGLRQFSFPDLAQSKEHGDGLLLFSLKFFPRLNLVLFNHLGRELICLDLNTNTETVFTGNHNSTIEGIEPTSDEKHFFTIGNDSALRKWETDSWSIINSTKLPFQGTCLALMERRGVVIVGIRIGSILEFTLDDLSPMKEYPALEEHVIKILPLPSGGFMCCSRNGEVKFSSSEATWFELPSNDIKSIILLDGGRLACACADDGVQIFSLDPDLLKPPYETEKNPVELSLFSLQCDTLSGRSQIFSFLHDRLFPNLPLKISLLPSLGSVSRSHLHKGVPEGKRRAFSSDLFLETTGSNSGTPGFEVYLTLPKRGLRLLGTCYNKQCPLIGFKANQIGRDKWVFSLEKEIELTDAPLQGSAMVNLLNGSLRCYVSDGRPSVRNGLRATLEVEGEVMEVKEISLNGVVTSNEKVFTLDFGRNLIQS